MTPWKAEPQGTTAPRDVGWWVVTDADGCIVAANLNTDDAALIVRAVNSHADLLAACEDMLHAYDDPMDSFGISMDGAIKRVRAAVAKARGEEEL